MRKPISREEEANLPRFESAEEAYRHFKGVYGRDFAFLSVEKTGDGEEYWYCHLILDRAAYELGNTALMQQSNRSGNGGGTLQPVGIEFLNSHQTVEISVSGSVHIVH